MEIETVPENFKPKILLIDIETKPMLGYIWGLWDNNVSLNMLEADWTILAFCSKWLGEEEIEYKDARGKGEDDLELLTRLWELLDEADYLIGHNLRRFDAPKINARFIQHGLLPPSPTKMIDTLQIARSRFNFTSNKLEYLADALGCSLKLKHSKFPGFELWKACMADNILGWEEMEAYNKQDVVSLEEVFYKLRPWMSTQLNHNLFIADDDADPVCNMCGSDELHKRGFSYTGAGKFQRFRCTGCGGWMRSTKRESGSKVTGITI